MKESVAKRDDVTYYYSALDWNFILMLAQIAHYAKQKYGAVHNYKISRLEGEKSPMNHLIEHYRSYLNQEPHDHFESSIYHLAAIAYNAMMEFHYAVTYGPHQNPCSNGEVAHVQTLEENLVPGNAQQSHDADVQSSILPKMPRSLGGKVKQ